MKTAFHFAAIALSLSQACHASFGQELKAYAFGTTDIVRDANRDRVYCAVPSQNSVVVIDSESLEIVATLFTGSQPAALSISIDGSKLYVANSGSTIQGIAEVDLDALTVSKYIVTQQPPTDVTIGNGTVYSLEGSSIRAYVASDGSTKSGTLSTYSGGVSVYGGILEISPDGSILYYYQTGLSPSSWYRINVASWPGTSIQSGTYGSNGQDMALSSDGQWITFASGSPYSVQKSPANNPASVVGQMDTGAYPRAVTYSPDGTRLFAVHTQDHIDVWNANTFVQLTPITSPGEARDLECDRKGKVLFAGTSTGLRAYLIAESSGQPLQVEINQAVEIRWNSISGSLYQVEWTTPPGPQSQWHPLGAPILGNGLTMSIYDTTRTNRAKFYRVSVVNP
ncbi:MAG: YncE family protein [Verrucomicrobiota bacterium]